MYESLIQADAIGALTAAGALVIRVNSLRAGHLAAYTVYPVKSSAGLPDLVVCYKGQTAFVEVKRERGRVSRAQAMMHALLRSRAIPVYIVRDMDDVNAVLADMDARAESIMRTLPTAATFDYTQLQTTAKRRKPKP